MWHSRWAILFTTHNMLDAAAHYFQEWCIWDGNKHWHLHEDGWYSVQVLTCLPLAIKTACEIRRCKGVFQKRRNSHWVAYRAGSDTHLYLLDSMRPFPVAITDEQFVTDAGLNPTFKITMEEGSRWETWTCNELVRVSIMQKGVSHRWCRVLEIERRFFSVESDTFGGTCERLASQKLLFGEQLTSGGKLLLSWFLLFLFATVFFNQLFPWRKDTDLLGFR